MIGKVTLAIVASLLAMTSFLLARTVMMESPEFPDVAPVPGIAIDHGAVAQRLARAVQYRTVSTNGDTPVVAGEFHRLHEHLVGSYPRMHETLKREFVSEFSLLYTWQGNDPSLKPILLNAHMDVVPVEPGTEGDWTHPPYAGAIADGFIWGRGVMDMKASLMGILEAVEYLLGRGFMPERTIYLAFGHDEEIGGTNGAAKITELLGRRGVRLEFSLDEGLVIAHDIVPGLAKPVALIGLAEKGYLTLELTVHGEGCHSSRPPKDTAIVTLARAIDRLDANQMPAALHAPASDMFDHLAAELSFVGRLAVANRWLFEPLILSRLGAKPATDALIHTTTATTVIGGGIKDNVIPAEATALVNFRLLPGDTIEDVENHVRDVVNDLDITLRQYRPGQNASAVSDSDTPSFRMLHETVRQVFPDVVIAPSLMIGGTDSKHYARIADSSFRFLPMRLHPEDVRRIHGIDERVSVMNYAEIIRFYVQLIRNTAGDERRAAE